MDEKDKLIISLRKQLRSEVKLRKVLEMEIALLNHELVKTKSSQKTSSI